MSSFQTGHGREGMRSQGANVDDGAESEAVDEVIADKEVEGEYWIGYGGEASKDNGEGSKSKGGGDEEGWHEESEQERFFSARFPFFRLCTQVFLHPRLGDHDQGGGHGEEFSLASIEPDEEHEEKLVGRLKGALSGGDHD